ncbi:LamG-like jellyroll fold domain-containing protein [Flagellimonas sp.]|uniref:LamG-like jellyroll fold domain-containing protein n=1 Tax=Flagellimonas sp. TaxID=2058762 RepID=UPI003B52EBDB
MKKTYKILAALVTVVFFTACDQGIDPITEVGAGADESAPQVTINYPTEGTEIKVFEDETTLDVDIRVTDDIEVKDIKVLLDGNQIASFNTFKDYRIVLEEFTYDGLKDGDHKLTVTASDIEGKTTTEEVNFAKAPPYVSMFDGEVFYMPFDGDYRDLIGFQQATEVGAPGFAGGGFVGSDAYRGTTDAYLEFPMDNLKSNEFSAAFWYKVNSTPDRAGILVVGDDADDRRQGFRLFREGSADEQRIKLNVGTGAGESWNDGGVIDVNAGEWVHIAISISGTKSTIYFNGMETLSADLAAPIDWTNCEVMTIGAGGPTFDYWNHKSDSSDMDELRIFNKALSQTDIQIMLNAVNPYIPKFPGESLYMPFEGDYIDLVGSKVAQQVGSTGFTNDSKEGDQAFMGATDSYINYPAEGLLTNEFSGAFWYKVNADPDRAGIIVIGDDADDRFQGFRLFREGSADEQRIKLNVGTGAGESWNDGDVIDVAAGEWVHITFTIANDKNTIYFNGVEVRSSDMSAPIDWTGCETFNIGSGGPTFDYWNHLSDLSAMDELRFFTKALSFEEVQEVYGGGYQPLDGETLYLPFNGNNTDLVSGADATTVGTPGTAGEGVSGDEAYAGATDSYLTFPTTNLTGDEFSATMWYKINADPDRAGILVMGPPDTENAEYPDVQNLRTNGFRFFREAGGDGQVFKLNAGNGTADSWFDGGATASIPSDTTDWVHLAFTISGTECVVYINGNVVAQGAFDGIDWSGCDVLSIGSGAPRFTQWNHKSDLSYIDELRLFNKALTQTEIQDIIN